MKRKKERPPFAVDGFTWVIDLWTGRATLEDYYRACLQHKAGGSTWTAKA